MIQQSQKFLADTRPLYLPSVTIGHIVSARLEKYRGLSEEWLARHGVRYRNLHLLDLPSKEVRMRTKAHCAHKIRIYRETKAPLFIESDDAQAAEIAQGTGKPVLSLATMKIHRGKGIYMRNLAPVTNGLTKKAKLGAKNFLKRTLPPAAIEKAKKARDSLKRLKRRTVVKR